MIRRGIVLLIALAALVLALALPAAAHDELIASIPADGYTVTTMPAAVTLTFAEATPAEDVTVTSHGHKLAVTAVAGDPHQVSVDLDRVPATETVQLQWRAVDDHDGHLTSGSLTFHVLDHADAGPAAPAPPDRTPAAYGQGLIASIPANGYSVTTLPAAAVLTFDATTRAAEVAVTAAGRKLTVSPVVGKPSSVSVDLAGVRATETVRLSWTKGAGIHRASGTIAFHVLDHVEAASASSSSSARPLRLHNLSVVTHLVGYLAMAVLLGGLFFVAVLWPAGARDRRSRMLLGSANVVGGLAAVVSVYVAVEQVAPLGFRDAVAQHFGRVSVSVALLWLLLSVVVVAMMQQPDVVRRTAWRVSAVVVAGGLIRAVGMGAHGTQGNHSTIGLLVDFLHLTAVSAWVGGLAVMLIGLLPRRQLSELERIVPRFSKVAATSVVLVIGSGTVLAWQVIGSLSGLFSTHYGHLLIIKVVLVSFVLLGALASKRWVERTLTGAVEAGRTSAIGSFVASVSAEAALVIGVLVAASLLVTSSPGV